MERAFINAIQLKMFQDIYCLLKNTSISPQNVCDISLEYGITPYVYCMLFYTHRIFQDPLLINYMSLVETDEGKALRDKYGLPNRGRKIMSIPVVSLFNNGELQKIKYKRISVNEIKKVNDLKKLF